MASKKCPVCAATHLWTGKDGKTFFKTRLSTCDEFKAKTPQERATIIAEAKGCVFCLDWTSSHKAADCVMKRQGKPLEPCSIKDGGVVCGRRHDPLVHGTNVAYCNSARRINHQGGPRGRGRVEPGAPSAADLRAADAKLSLFQYQSIPCNIDHIGQVNTFFDGGANVNLVSKEFIRRAKLPGRPVFQSLVTTGANEADWHTEAYHVPIVDRWGEEHTILAYSMGDITKPIEEVDLRLALQIFPELGGDYNKIKRPRGKVDLLIGTNDVRLHPYLADPRKHLQGNLRLMTSMFGSGLLVDGSHPSIKVGPHRNYQEEASNKFEQKKQ